ncbi:IMPACT family protein [Dermacoccaceae bacterium W4C1]
MPHQAFRTLTPGSELVAEVEEKRSRFLAHVVRVSDEPAARAVIAARRSAHPDARHHCSAFRLGPDPVTERSNDDGEPSGTAGNPMLEVLRGQGLSDVVAVVTRWFGGTLLGTGGLARAYADAVNAALDGAPVVLRRAVPTFRLDLAHADAGRVEAELRAAGVTVLDTQYAEQVHLSFATADEQIGDLVAAVTSGACAPVPLGTVWGDEPL